MKTFFIWTIEVMVTFAVIGIASLFLFYMFLLINYLFY